MNAFKRILSSIVKGAVSYSCTAIIVAAGNGSRMGANAQTTKQMMDVGGMPAVARTIKQFEDCKSINDIIIVAREDELPIYGKMKKKYGFKKIKKVTAGANTRQKSVLCGFRHISDKCDFVCIHDGVRCLITPDKITKVIKAAQKYGAASAACPVKDTVKITDSDGFVISTPERCNVWNAQTPQVFKSDLYRAAAFYAEKKGFCATDDNSLAEWIGAKVKMVDCGYDNIKITTVEDIHSANAILKSRGESVYD